MEKEIICIACSIFKKELEEIQNKKLFSFEIKYMDSMLHMNPQKLSTILNNQTHKYADKNIILLYGDCQPEMNLLEKQTNVYRSPGINCCNIVLANKRYKELRKSGAFILMEEWVNRWEEVFKKELGFKSQENAKTFMQEMHSKLVYLDSGKIEIPYEILETISNYFILPYCIEKTDANNIINIINEAINWFENKQAI